VLGGLHGHERFQFAVVCLMAVGQTIFVITWATRPWWQEWIGRALMIKSAALDALLIMSIGFTMVMLRSGELSPWMWWTQDALDALVLAGIWSQVLAMTHEIRKGKLARVWGRKIEEESDV
jgi:hypothetical protein